MKPYTPEDAPKPFSSDTVDRQRLLATAQALAATAKGLEDVIKYIDEAVASRAKRYDEKVKEFGRNSPEAKRASDHVHEVVNATRNAHGTAYMALRAIGARK